MLTWALMLSVFHPSTIWAGGAGNGVPAVRESFLAHICTAGPNRGQPCTVAWAGGGDPFAVVSEDCPGACVIDYESAPFEGDFFVMVDEDVAAPSNSETVLDVPIVTALLCIEKKAGVLGKTEDFDKVEGVRKKQDKKTAHCFTESYRPAADGSGFIFGGVGFPLVNNVEEQLVASAEEGLATSEPGKETMLLFWKFGLHSVLTPTSDLTQALRNFYKKTGVVTVTDINRIGTDDHVEDTTGSVLRFRMKLQFVKAPRLGP